MIIYSGRGGFVLAFVGIAYLCLISLKPGINSTDGMAYSSLIGAIPVYFFGRLWNKPKVVFDDKTQKSSWVKPNHTFFWIPMQYWSMVWIIIGVLILIFSK